MKKSLFKDVRLVLAEPKPETQTAIRDGLRARGFLDIVTTSSMGKLEDTVGENLVDLVICDTEIDNEAFPAFSKLVRQGGHGPNPYLLSIGVTETPSEENVKRIIDAGIDSVLIKPFSMNAMLDSISALIHWRKSFVVSANYIGPDRRLRPRQQVCLPLIDVPNTLKEHVDQTYDEARILRDIAATNEKVNLQRMTQDAVLINEIVKQIVPHYEAGQKNDTVLIHLHHLLRTAHDISRRMREGSDKNVISLCKSLIPIVETLLENHLSPDMKNVRLLQNVSTAIYMAYNTDEKTESLSNDIAESIQGAKRFSGT